MKIGDMVRPLPLGHGSWGDGAPADGQPRVGIIVGFLEERDFSGIAEVYMPIVYWSAKFPSEVEYRDQIEVISVASRTEPNFMASR